MSVGIIAAFLSMFVFAWIHVGYDKQYQGQSQLFGLMISSSAIFGPLLWLVLIIYNGIVGVWWNSLVAFLICFTVGPILARVIQGPYYGLRSVFVAMFGFIAWPVSAWVVLHIIWSAGT